MFNLKNLHLFLKRDRTKWTLHPFILLSFLIGFGYESIAQVSFKATSDAKEVVENGYFQVTFTLNNAQGSNFKAPDFKGFKVVGGPSRSMSTTIINGKTSQKIAYSYSLQPSQKGTYTVSPATIMVNGQLLKSNSISITVLAAGTANKAASEEQQLFVRAEVDTNLVYVGQQLILNYKLYTTVNIENYDIAFEPEYKGFFARDIRRFDSRVVREIKDGVQYSTKILKRVALFPQQTGLQIINPMSVRLGLVIGNKRPNSFFFSNRIKPVNVQTNSLEINVKSLPLPIPPQFSGAVGKYSMQSFVNKSSLTTDDALSVKLRILGNGDIKRLQIPDLKFPPQFEVYDPKIIEENVQESTGTINGQKTIEYLAIPKQPGQYQLNPSFIFFDPDSARFVTLTPNEFNLSVRKGNNVIHTVTNTLKPEKKDIRYIKTATSIHPPTHSLTGSRLFYSLAILPFLILGGGVVYKRLLEKNSTIDITLVKSKRAEKVAVKRLITAKKFLKDQNSKHFYKEISNVLLGYICDKLSIPVSELTKENVVQRLQQLKVNEHHIQEYISLLKVTEMALFSGMDNEAAMQETYHKSVKLISEIEMELNRINVLR